MIAKSCSRTPWTPRKLNRLYAGGAKGDPRPIRFLPPSIPPQTWKYLFLIFDLMLTIVRRSNLVENRRQKRGTKGLLHPQTIRKPSLRVTTIKILIRCSIVIRWWMAEQRPGDILYYAWFPRPLTAGCKIEVTGQSLIDPTGDPRFSSRLFRYFIRKLSWISKEVNQQQRKRH